MSKSTKRILLVEDEFESQFMIDLLLNQYQCHTDVVSDGLAAIQKACALPYDCILMDLGLPKLDGIQTFLTIKKIFKVHSLTMPPVIALTEYINHSLIEQCFELGMVSVLFKPLKDHHINRLFSRLKQLEQREICLNKTSQTSICINPGLSLAKPILSEFENKQRQEWSSYNTSSPSQQTSVPGASLHENQAVYCIEPLPQISPKEPHTS